VKGYVSVGIQTICSNHTIQDKELKCCTKTWYGGGGDCVFHYKMSNWIFNETKRSYLRL